MNVFTGNQSKRFLIGQLARYGDCLYATTIARQIKKDYPGSHITWAIASNFSSILLLNPYVDEIWEISINNDDYYKEGWKKFEKLALQYKEQGKFDVIIFSQVAPLNFINYTGTIRATILSTYKKPITVSVNPVLVLSDGEVNHVKKFALQHQLKCYKNVILFECMPGSGQSNVSPDFAVKIAKSITSKYDNVCFILSAQNNNFPNHPRILNAATLSFRENAELTHYCTMLVGCSSGITWISTSEWAKKISMLQLYSKKPSIYAGVHHDFAINGLDNSHIIEIPDDSASHIIEVIEAMMNEDLKKVKMLYHQKNVPGYRDFTKIVEQLVRQQYSFSAILKFAKTYSRKSFENGAPLYINYTLFSIKLRLTQLNRILINIANPIKRKIKPKNK